MTAILKIAKETLKQEAEALLRLAENLGTDFERAVEIIAGTTGRVIVTGMGKSGHIGAKLAATFASTGTPSFFVHPGEASHGDLGMITQEDAVIALSHSGGTKELSDVVAHCQRFDIPLIAMTGRAESVLGKASTIALINGVTEEACPLNLAPTSSTTASLALGDALAVALMQKKGFESKDFAGFHPGGKLGSKLMRVSDMMVSGDDLPIVDVSALMDTAIVEMSSKRLGLVLVMQDHILAGVITDGDLRRHLSADLMQKPVSEVMTVSPTTITPGEFAAHAVAVMQSKAITALPVLEKEKPVGIIHIHHCLQQGVA